MSSRCPVSGSPIRRDEAWVDVEVGRSRLTLSVIGDRIVHSRPTGTVSLGDFPVATQVIRQVVAEAIAPGQTYVLIEDYSDLDGIAGSTLAMRRQYVTEMLERDDLAGLVFCHVPVMLDLSIKLGRQIYPFPFPIEVVPDYAGAVRSAQELLSGSATPPPTAAWERGRPGALARLVRWILGRRGAPPKRLPGPAERRRPAPDLARRQVQPLPTLDLDLEGLSVRYEVIDGDILHANTSGHLEPRHVQPLIERNGEALATLGTPGWLVIGVPELTGAALQARRQYISGMTAVQREHPFEEVVFYSPNRWLRTMIALSRSLVPFPVTEAADLPSALDLLDRRRESGTTPAAGAPDAHLLDDHLSEFLHFLGSITWDIEGAVTPRVPEGHPLEPAFDAIELLKVDVDHLLHERREGELALAQSARLLRTVIDATNEAILSVDRDGRVDLFNASAEELFGRPAAAVRGSPFDDLLTETGQHPWRDLLDHHLDGSAPGGQLVELEARRAGGDPFPLELSLSSAVYGGHRHLIAVGRDQTDRYRAEEEKQRLERQLEHAQRMQSLGTLAGGVAHDFNNLLMTIQGSISVLLMDAEPGTESHEALELIDAQIRSGANLTGQLLAYARKGRYAVRPLDLNQVVTQISEAFWRTHKGLRVHRDLEQGLPAIDADRSQIEQVVLNLVLNAGDAMPTGGDLYLSTCTLRGEELPDEIRPPGARSWVRLQVRDTGHGMEERIQSRIFEPFFTTKEMGHGTGLGLASVYGTVEAHGGHITVRSEVGRGTCFEVYFPASESPVSVSARREQPMTASGHTLLLVDDERLVLRVSAHLLEKLGFSVLCASSGLEALDIYAASGDRIDLVILDMIMPDMGGGETFDQLRGMDPEVKVLLSSGYSLEGEARQILARGCDGFIQKPFDIDQITTRIAEILDPA